MGYRYLKGLAGEYDLNGETVVGLVDDQGNTVSPNRDLRFKASRGPGVALVKQSKRDPRLPSGWTVLTEEQYISEFQVLMGRPPSSVEV